MNSPRTFAALFLVPLLLTAAPTLEQIAADPALWPQEVTVSASTKATVLKNDQPAGVMLVGAGKKIAVTNISAAGVTGKLGSDTVRVPADKTDLLAPEPAPAAPTVVAAPKAAAPAAKPARSPVVPAARKSLSPMQQLLDARLVRLQAGKLASVNTDQALAGVQYFALYYSASWCGPCRQFTPHLVQAYRELKQRYPQFELVFISNDHSAADMAGYMKEDKMPWPALTYESIEGSELNRYLGPGIPCLVLVDANGKVLADSFRGEQYLGPGHVLNETQRILAKGG